MTLFIGSRCASFCLLTLWWLAWIVWLISYCNGTVYSCRWRWILWKTRSWFFMAASFTMAPRWGVHNSWWRAYVYAASLAHFLVTTLVSKWCRLLCTVIFTGMMWRSKRGNWSPVPIVHLLAVLIRQLLGKIICIYSVSSLVFLHRCLLAGAISVASHK